MNVCKYGWAIVCFGLVLSACVPPDMGGSSVGSGGSGGAMGTGGSGGTGGGSSAASSSTGMAEPCGECPASPDPCHEVACVSGSCLLAVAPAGAECVRNNRGDRCNGYGVCGVISCVTAADCGPTPPCFGVECAVDGPLANVCASVPDNAGTCGNICAPVLKGSEIDECGPGGAVAFYCTRDDGPLLGPDVCSRPDAPAHPYTWCCNIPTK